MAELRDKLIEKLLAAPIQSPVWLSLGGFGPGYEDIRRRRAATLVDAVLTTLAEEEPGAALVKAAIKRGRFPEFNDDHRQDEYAEMWKAMTAALRASRQSV